MPKTCSLQRTALCEALRSFKRSGVVSIHGGDERWREHANITHAYVCTAHAHMNTAHAHVGTRAKQDTPPAVRRAVMQRDHHRCRVPGCRNATFLDVHHLRLRSDGGAHVAANLIAVCSAHHDALHRGQLRTEGDADALRFLHADGRDYGQPQQPRSIEVQTKVSPGCAGSAFARAMCGA